MKALTLIFIAFASYSQDYKSYKENNQPIKTKCINFRDRTPVQKKSAFRLQHSLSNFLNETIPLAKRKFSGIAHTNIADTTMVLVFNRPTSGLGSSSDTLFRTEERAEIENHVRLWKAKESQAQKYDIVIRFEDECEVPPPPKWK